jgi:hypothetical protein
MHRIPKTAVVLAVLTIGMTCGANAEEFHAKLSGFQEVGALNNETGAIFSGGTGTLRVTVDNKLQSANYTLTYSGLSASVTQAHIHFGKEHVPGGIFAFLCTNLGNGPAGTPACPAGGGTVTGMITPASILGVASQHIAAGDFNILTQAFESDTAYGNVHTVNFPAGEIRGQIRERGHDRDR